MSTAWTICRWRCRREHRHPLRATDEALRQALVRVARRRGRWAVVDAGSAVFGQAAARGDGLLGVELSDAAATVVWPMRCSTDGPGRWADAVPLRGTGRRRAPIDFPSRAQLTVDEAVAVIGRHLRGEDLPAGFDAMPALLR